MNLIIYRNNLFNRIHINPFEYIISISEFTVPTLCLFFLIQKQNNEFLYKSYGVFIVYECRFLGE